MEVRKESSEGTRRIAKERWRHIAIEQKYAGSRSTGNNKKEGAKRKWEGSIEGVQGGIDSLSRKKW